MWTYNSRDNKPNRHQSKLSVFRMMIEIIIDHMRVFLFRLTTCQWIFLSACVITNLIDSEGHIRSTNSNVFQYIICLLVNMRFRKLSTVKLENFRSYGRGVWRGLVSSTLVLWNICALRGGELQMDKLQL